MFFPNPLEKKLKLNKCFNICSLSNVIKMDKNWSVVVSPRSGLGADTLDISKFNHYTLARR